MSRRATCSRGGGGAARRGAGADGLLRGGATSTRSACAPIVVGAIAVSLLPSPFVSGYPGGFGRATLRLGDAHTRREGPVPWWAGQAMGLVGCDRAACSPRALACFPTLMLPLSRAHLLFIARAGEKFHCRCFYRRRSYTFPKDTLLVSNELESFTVSISPLSLLS